MPLQNQQFPIPPPTFLQVAPLGPATKRAKTQQKSKIPSRTEQSTSQAIETPRHRHWGVSDLDLLTDSVTPRSPQLRLGSPAPNNSQEVDSPDKAVDHSTEVKDEIEREPSVTDLLLRSTPRFSGPQLGPQQTTSASERGIHGNTAPLTTDKASPPNTSAASVEDTASHDVRDENAPEEVRSSQEHCIETKLDDSFEQIAQKFSSTLEKYIESLESDRNQIERNKNIVTWHKWAIEDVERKITSLSEARAKVKKNYDTTEECLKKLQCSLDNVESLGILDARDGLRDSMAKVRATQKEHEEEIKTITKDIEQHNRTRQAYHDKDKNNKTDLSRLKEKVAKMQELVEDGGLFFFIAGMEIWGIKELVEEVPELFDTIRQIAEQGTKAGETPGVNMKVEDH
ncbi:hypothetical protein FSARC_680 [Fusarium sarcochroum]|uniref:Uncharacterized protein n=1 Tax=Fusarium sarcochroum TaxID=1208366 RepID=A0A8H4UAW3_9HYPO|nr:hypothetical protein FSARC_680 [Fusarium sarcochroum]